MPNASETWHIYVTPDGQRVVSNNETLRQDYEYLIGQQTLISA